MKTASQAEHFRFFRSSSIVLCGTLPGRNPVFGRPSHSAKIAFQFGTFFGSWVPALCRICCREHDLSITFFLTSWLSLPCTRRRETEHSRPGLLASCSHPVPVL